jgi:dipeptidyl-peptidase-4
MSGHKGGSGDGERGTAVDYPRRAAITRRFTLGVPRDVAIVGPPGARWVLALRSDAADDPVTHLWRFDPVTGEGVRLLDARALGAAEEDLPPEERARRERVREQAGGVTAYTVDRAGTRVACALGGQLVVVDVASVDMRVLPLDVPVFDPRISPDGRRVALHHDDGVSVVDLDEVQGSERPHLRRLVEEPGAVWGRAEFIAAEEMTRLRGMWWSPCSTRLAVTRFDESAVERIHLADLARPDRDPVVLAYPFAGTRNAEVSLAVVDVATGERRMLDLSAAGSADTEYLARVVWDVEPLLVAVQPRDQRALHVLALDGERLRSVRRATGEPWFELLLGAPAWLDGLLTIEDVAAPDGTLRRALCRDGVALTPPGIEVRAILAVHRATGGAEGDLGTVVLSVSHDDPTSVDVVSVRIARHGVDVGRITDEGPGVHHALLSFTEEGELDVVVRRSAVLDDDLPRVTMELHRARSNPVTHVLPSMGEPSGLDVRVTMLELGSRRLRAALVMPADDALAAGPLPVVLDPYGGPHAQRVLSARSAYHGAQWLADQGFAVLVVDGRGTPGRGPGFEHEVHGDLASLALADQIDALDALGEAYPLLDVARVGIRGWSYGGTLAALAALRRPDRIRCAVVGAPVTDWRLYDTHYTERYLGHPDRDPDAYLRSGVVLPDGSLVAADPIAASAPHADMLIVHGLVDDNVLAAHSLRLTEALHAAGRPFTFLPLTNATHMASDPAVAARLLEVQAAFLLRHLRG